MTKVAEIRAKPISDGAQMRLANRDMPGADRPLNSSLGLQMYNSKGLLGRLVDNNEDLKLVRKDTVLAGDLRWPVNALGQGTNRGRSGAAPGLKDAGEAQETPGIIRERPE